MSNGQVRREGRTVSLPWFKAPTMDTLDGMLGHEWSKDSPCPAYVAVLELGALQAAGMLDAWSQRRLAARWGWTKSRVHRLLIAERTENGPAANQKRTKKPAPQADRRGSSEPEADQQRTASRGRVPLGEKEEEENPPTPQRGKRKKPSVWEAPAEVQALAESMRESWGGRLSWSVSSPLQGMSRLQCLGWWLGLYESEGRPRNPEPYSAEEIQAAWEVYLDEDWARAPGRGIMTFLRLAQLPKWCEAGTPPLFPTQSVDYVESYDLGSMTLEDAEAAFTRPQNWTNKHAQGEP